MKQVQFTAEHFTRDYRFDVHIRKARWLPLFVEQWLVPRFVLTITNKGKDIDKGTVDCELVEHDKISSFPSVKKGFQDFQHIMFHDFKNGDRRKFNLKIESRFIRPTRYMTRILM